MFVSVYSNNLDVLRILSSFIMKRNDDSQSFLGMFVNKQVNEMHSSMMSDFIQDDDKGQIE